MHSEFESIDGFNTTEETEKNNTQFYIEFAAHLSRLCNTLVESPSQ